jgi:hypothetical protein
MKSRRFPFIVALLLAVMLCGGRSVQATPIAAGDYVTMSDLAGNTGGGEFLMTSASNAWQAFITFCIQRTQYIDFSNTFRIDAVTTAAATELPATGGDGTGRDPLSSQTAFLYTNFRNGTLTGYNYGAGRGASADLLQNAIWMFEGELPMDVTNSFVVLANTAVNTGTWSGLGTVRALNMSYLGGREAQDQLAMIPTPHQGTDSGKGYYITQPLNIEAAYGTSPRCQVGFRMLNLRPQLPQRK